MARELTIKNREEANVYSESLAGTNDWTNLEFICVRSILLNHVAVQKPSASVVQMEVVYPDGGATVLLFVSGGGVASGVYDELAKMVLPPGTVLRLTSTGGISGAKVVSVIISRADA